MACVIKQNKGLFCHRLHLIGSSGNTGIESLELVRRHEVTVAMDTDSVVESFDVFEDQPVGVVVIFNLEAVKPLAFDQSVERFDAGIVVGITFVAVAELKPFRGFPVCL